MSRRFVFITCLFSMLLSQTTFAQDFNWDWETSTDDIEWEDGRSYQEVNVYQSYSSASVFQSRTKEISNQKYRVIFTGIKNNINKNGKGEFKLRLIRGESERFDKTFNYVPGKGDFYVGKIQLLENGTTAIFFYAYKSRKIQETRIKLIDAYGDETNLKCHFKKGQHIKNIYAVVDQDSYAFVSNIIQKVDGVKSEIYTTYGINESDGTLKILHEKTMSMNELFGNVRPGKTEPPGYYIWYVYGSQIKQTIPLSNGDRIDIVERYSLKAKVLSGGNTGITLYGFQVMRINENQEIQWIHNFPQLHGYTGNRAFTGTFAFTDDNENIHVLFNDLVEYYDKKGNYVIQDEFMDHGSPYHKPEKFGPVIVSIDGFGEVTDWRMERTDDKPQYFIPVDMAIAKDKSKRMVKIARGYQRFRNLGVLSW